MPNQLPKFWIYISHILLFLSILMALNLIAHMYWKSTCSDT